MRGSRCPSTDCSFLGISGLISGAAGVSDVASGADELSEPQAVWQLLNRAEHLFVFSHTYSGPTLGTGDISVNR
jgi:hypothetical protein